MQTTRPCECSASPLRLISPDRGLLRYEASAGTVMFFRKDLLPDDRVTYTNAKGRETYKQVVGFSKVLNAHWHLGMRATVRLGEDARRPAAALRGVHAGRKGAAEGR